MSKSSKLYKIKREYLSKKEVDNQQRTFGKDDLLKHYIRKKYWEQRTKSLRSDLKPDLDKGIKYFSLCSRHSFDVRLLKKDGLIDEGGFAYCENVKNDFDFIEQIFVRNRLNGNGVGFNASLADIATDVHHQKYGQFWSRFPFDVINLDYFGDIFKTNNQNFAVPDFTTIQDIIFHQARSKRQYELWLTMRIKPLRIPAQVKLTFTDLIEENIKNLHFKTAFTKNYPSANKPADLDDEMLYYTGFLKWLYYVCFSSYSIIRNMKVLKYKRNGKDGDDYNIFNILLRIEPYQTAFILSPVGDHVRACKDEYNKGIVNALATPIDVDKEFRELKGSERKRLRQELDSLSNDFFQDEKGWFASAN